MLRGAPEVAAHAAMSKAMESCRTVVGFMMALIITSATLPSELQSQRTGLLGKLDPVRIITGRSLEDQVARRAKRVERGFEKFLDNPVEYIASRPASILGDVCAAVPRTYEGFMRGRVTTWLALPPELIAAAQSNYNFDLRTVRYAVNVPTSNGAAQTFGNVIYFPRTINLATYDDLHWMLHELEHADQFATSRAGKSAKLCEYMAKGIAAGGQHDDHEMEIAAERKANWLAPQLYSRGDAPDLSGAMSRGTYYPASNEVYFTNPLDVPVYFALRSASRSGYVTLLPRQTWVAIGSPGDSWFEFQALTNTARGPIVTSWTLDGGTRQVIGYNRDGAVDTFLQRF